MVKTKIRYNHKFFVVSRIINLKPAGLTVLKRYAGFRTVLLGLTIVKKLFYLNNFFYQQKYNCLIIALNFTGFNYTENQ